LITNGPQEMQRMSRR